MKKSFYLCTIIALAFVACQTSKTENSWTLQSPDSNLSTKIELNETTGELTYSLSLNEKSILETSPLGINFKEQDFSKGLKFASSSTKDNQTEEYTLISGKQLKNTANWNELELVFSNANNQTLKTQFRLYPEGLTFRYIIESETDQSYTLSKEFTGFNLPDIGKAWMQAYDSIVWWAPAYETYFENEIEIGTKAPWNKNGWSFPMLFNANDCWTLISESNLQKGFVGMHLESECSNGLYTMRLPESNEAYDVCNNTPVVQLPITSPWRTISTGNNLNDIVSSNLIYHVAEECAVEDISWIKPGRSSWSWWSDNPSPRDYTSLAKFVDFAEAEGWEYSLVDANWNEMKGGSLEELAAYANKKGVGILAWYNSGGSNNIVTEKPRDLMHERETRKSEFKKLQEWGVKGIKVDFFQSDKACIINQYIEILEDAAEFEILVNFHGCTLPRGWRRTYPNLVTMEAVKGAEAYRFASDYNSYGTLHNTILPFTRNVVGPMDYTPVTFSDAKFPHSTSYAHELALSVVFESGIQHFADKIDAYKAIPDYALDFLNHVPVAWDETKCVDGYPGKYAVIARKKDDVWYIGAINGLEQEQAVKFTADFLDEGKYKLAIISDGENDESFQQETKEIAGGAQIEMEMPAFGGFVMTLTKE